MSVEQLLTEAVLPQSPVTSVPYGKLPTVSGLPDRYPVVALKLTPGIDPEYWNCGVHKLVVAKKKVVPTVKYWFHLGRAGHETEGVAPSTVILQLLNTGGAALLSTKLTVHEKVPAVVGVPVKVPADTDSASPAGSVPEERAKVKGATPLVKLYDDEYNVLRLAQSIGQLVKDTWSPNGTPGQLANAVLLCTSVTRTTNGIVDETTGVPTIDACAV